MIQTLFKYHSEWLRISKAFGNGDESEDVVQEMYLKLHNNNKVIENGKINKGYIYLTIKSITIDKYRTKEDTVQINEQITSIEETPYSDEIDTFFAENECYWYDKEIFYLYLLHNSYRKIQKLTGINYAAIKRSVCHVKKNLKKWKDLEIQSNK